jgi:hypothetical protein
MMVATQSRFHRDMPDGEQIALKPLKFYAVPNLQFATQAHCGCWGLSLGDDVFDHLAVVDFQTFATRDV